jgi:hypothetical protein
MVEGIDVANINSFNLTLDYGSFNEATVGTGGFGVEWPSPGVQMQFHARSGGNRYAGSLYADTEPRQWQSVNIDSDQIARGVTGSAAVPPPETNRAWAYADVNADLGGFIRRDRAWWYASARRQHAETRVVNFPVVPLETRLTNYTGKVTVRLGPAHRVIGFLQTSQAEQPTRLEPFGLATLSANTALFLSESATTRSSAHGTIWKGEWNASLGESVFVEARAGQFLADRRDRPNGAGPRSEDVGLLVVTGGGRDWQDTLRRDQAFGSISFSPRTSAGRHSVKAGGELIRILGTEGWLAGYPGDVLHVFRNLQPLEVYLLQTPSRSQSGLWWLSAYGSDTWQIGRFTLAFGARFDRYRVFLPAQSHPAGRFNPQPESFAAVSNLIDWNVVAPRIGIVWDLAGNARTLIKAAVNQYWLVPSLDVGIGANPNSNLWWRQYRWSDADGNRQWDPGEEGALLNARGGNAVQAIDPDLQLPYVREATLMLERELRPDTAVRTGLVWRGERRQFLRQNSNRPHDGFSSAVLVPDPGPDGRAGTEDDGALVPAWQLDPAFVGLPVENLLSNAPASASDYWTWEVEATMRSWGRWSASGGFAHTWLRDQGNGYLGQSVRQNLYPLNPNDYLQTDAGGRHVFRMWSLKMYATYAGPWDLRITPFLRHQSGQPYGRTIVAQLNYSTVRMLVEPLGTRRMDHVTLADIRIEKGVSLGSGRRLAGFVDVFNLFNANAEQAISWSSGTFQRPLSIVPPRVARVGVNVRW